MNVPLLDLKSQLSQLHNEITRAVCDVVDSTNYILGPVVSSFEEEIADYCDVSYGVGVSSGTDALLISLMALEIGPGDEVLTTPYTFFATIGAILRVGARPVFVDIEPDSMNIDSDKVVEILEKNAKEKGSIKAVLPVHLFGQCSEMEKIMSVCHKHGLAVIEDAAQAIGSECPFEADNEIFWKKAGSMGNMGCFSFFPSKNLGGIGDGGLVTTNDERLADRLVTLRNHGAKPKYFHSYIGGNFRLDPIQAAVLKVKLPYLDSWHIARRTNSEQYRQLFENAGLVNDPVVLPPEVYRNFSGANSRNYHIFNQFIIRVPKRDELRMFLQKNNIGCEVYYPLCIHQQKCLESYGVNEQSFPSAEETAARSLALPIYPELSIDQLRYVVETISRFFKD